MYVLSVCICADPGSKFKSTITKPKNSPGTFGQPTHRDDPIAFSKLPPNFRLDDEGFRTVASRSALIYMV